MSRIEVIEASGGEEALAILDGGRAVDILLTDHLMPLMSGIELARAARERVSRLGILVMSGYSEFEWLAPDLPRLQKPFNDGSRRFWAVGPCIAGGLVGDGGRLSAFIDSPFYRKPGNPGFAELARHPVASFVFLRHDRIWTTRPGEVFFPEAPPFHGRFELRFPDVTGEVLSVSAELKDLAAEFNAAAMGRYFEATVQAGTPAPAIA